MDIHRHIETYLYIHTHTYTYTHIDKQINIIIYIYILTHRRTVTCMHARMPRYMQIVQGSNECFGHGQSV